MADQAEDAVGQYRDRLVLHIGYIVSNLIGITDGHLLFDAALFNQGQRPAIDTRFHKLAVMYTNVPVLS